LATFFSFGVNAASFFADDLPGLVPFDIKIVGFVLEANLLTVPHPFYLAMSGLIVSLARE